ncbi:hypothetical protein BDN70DRAFT_571614 [Pholiota conissans]|uniref:Uncharacterized protein n=1 Tax=Pholiota conissans TaxID=109636 RepID=A0A9P5YPR2_9AGAR|nr:hypothetical protein BDN70DRAFT_571614 [Pholiota conissans]
MGRLGLGQRYSQLPHSTTWAAHCWSTPSLSPLGPHTFRTHHVTHSTASISSCRQSSCYRPVSNKAISNPICHRSSQSSILCVSSTALATITAIEDIIARVIHECGVASPVGARLPPPESLQVLHHIDVSTDVIVQVHQNSVNF